MSRYSKETAETIIKKVSLLNGWLKDGNLRIDESGVWIEPFLDCEGNSILTTEESNALEWNACCELDGPDASDPRMAPVLPIPFSERELAAFMIDGVGWFFQEVYGPLQKRPDESVLKSFSVVDKKAKEAIIGAYAAFQEAEGVVMQAQPYWAEVARAETLRFEYQKALGSANIEAGVSCPEISNDERESRKQVALAAVAPSYENWQRVQRLAEQIEPIWRHQIVNSLLGPTNGHAAVEPARVPGGDKRQKTNTTHKIKNRVSLLSAEIQQARETALDSDDAGSVWAELIKMAGSKHGLLIAQSSDGIQYMGKKYQDTGIHDVLTLGALRDRMRRAKNR